MGVVTELCSFLPKTIKRCDMLNENYIEDIYGIDYAKLIFDQFPQQFVYQKRIQIINETYYPFETYIEWCSDKQEHCYFRMDNNQFVSNVKPHHYRFKKVRHINYKIKNEFKGCYLQSLFDFYIDMKNVYILKIEELEQLKHSYIENAPINNWALNKYNFIHISW